MAAFREVTDYVATTTRVFACYEDRLNLGFICVDEERNTVELVYVPDFLRGRGIATKLLEHAREETGLSLEFDTGERTLLGSAWARKQGLQILPGLRYQRIGQRAVASQIARLGWALMWEPEEAR